MADVMLCQSISRKMKMNSSLGVNLRVTGHCNQGDRKYMEDMYCVAYQPTEDGQDLEYAYFGIFDGHGGKEAAVFAREHLMEFIVGEKKFWSDHDADVLSAIKSGYLATHNAMWKQLANWPKTASGLPSTSGTTATIAFIRNGKIYVGHVGDSALVLGYQETPGPPHESLWRATSLTRDHKPESDHEMDRIYQCGGKVRSKSGVPRVVWNRPRIGHKGPVRRSTLIDEIPFLAVARSLGDLWSYNSDSDQFVVSPVPDVQVVKIDTSKHRCLVFGTDGFWNMVNPLEAMLIVRSVDRKNQALSQDSDQQTGENMWVNPSKRLVDRALRKWNSLLMRADNTSVVTLLLNPRCSQGGCHLSNTTIVSHNHDAKPLTPPESPPPLEAVEPDTSEPDSLHFVPLTDAIPHCEPAAADEPKITCRHNESLSVNTKSSGDSRDGNEKATRAERAAEPEPAIQCAEIGSSGADQVCLRDMKSCKVVLSRGDEREPAGGLSSSSDSTPSPSPSASAVLHPIAASTPAHPASGAVCYAKSETLQRRGRTHPLKGVLNGAGAGLSRNVLPLSSNVQSSSHLRGIKRRHSSSWDDRNATSSSQGKEMKKRTRSEEKPLLGSSNGSGDKYNTEDAENERLAWPAAHTMRPCEGDGGSEENKVLTCSFPRKKKWMRSNGITHSGLRQARSRASGHMFLDRREHSRILRSDTSAASQSHSRTLRSRNVDVRMTDKIPLMGSKIGSSKRGGGGSHLRPLSSELSPFSRSSNLVQVSKSAAPAAPASPSRRRLRAVVTRSRV